MRSIALLTLCIALAVCRTAGALELEECRINAGPAYPGIKARCGTLRRPENPGDPESPEIEISVAVVPALSLAPQPDPFVPIAGGPGQGTIEFYSGYANAFEAVRRERDILLVDQRGTGKSSRLDCEFDGEFVSGQHAAEEVRAASSECLEGLPHDARYFTTSVAVTDLEAVREALGYPQLNLYGVSYGSRVAQHYARRYPEATRTVVLDGVVPPQLPLGPEIAIEAQRAIDSIIARCTEDAACAGRFPDLARSFARLRAELGNDAVPVRLPHPVTGELETVDFGDDELAIAIRLLAYSPSSIALLPLLIHEGADGNLTPLAAQFLLISSSLADSIALGMHNSVMCTEDVPFFDESAIDYDALAASYIGPEQVQALRAICSVWPTGPIDPGFHEPLATDIPVLLLSGDADPITPPRYAELAKTELGNAVHLVGINQGHGQAAVGCLPSIIGDFVATADPGQIESDCLKRSFAMPFFLDFGGPTP